MPALHPQPFESFVAPARPRAELWRLVLGLALSLAIYLAFVFGLLAAIRWLTGPQAVGVAEALTRGLTATSTLILLASFAGMAAGPMLAVRLLHRRPAASLFGPPARVLRDFLATALAAGAVYGLSILLWLTVFTPQANLDFGPWLLVLPLALAGVALQTGAEELVFRGYIQQQLAARFRSPIAWLLLPSVVFGMVHYDPETMGPNTWITITAAVAFGLAAADLTARTGSLGAAWGLHFTNNCFALLIIATSGTLEGLALFTTPYSADAAGPVRFVILADLVVLFLAWSLARRLLRR